MRLRVAALLWADVMKHHDALVNHPRFQREEIQRGAGLTVATVDQCKVNRFLPVFGKEGLRILKVNRDFVPRWMNDGGVLDEVRWLRYALG
jgi:hypothetical protein